MSFSKKDLKPIHYKLIGSAVAIVMLLVGMVLTEMNIIGKDGVYVSLDVSSRVEMELHPDLTVKNAILYNEDGGKVTNKLNLTGRPLSEAVAILANVMEENKFFMENGRYILVGVNSHEDDIDSSVVADDVVSTLNSVLQDMEPTKEYYVDSIVPDDLSNRLKEMTKEYKVSYAKAAVIQKLFREINGYTMNQLARKPMGEIYELMFDDFDINDMKTVK